MRPNFSAERSRERAHEQRLRRARHALEQHVPARQERDQRLVDHLILSHHALRYRRANPRHGLGHLLCCHHDVSVLSM